MRLARGTAHLVQAAAAVTLVVLVLFLTLFPSGWGLAATLLSAAATLFLANFFRDPERPIAEGLCCPADGVVRAVQETGDGGREVSIFMNLHDVHVNRAPCDATVRSVTHVPGALLPAWHKDSGRNERVVWELDTPHGPVRVAQIAGLLARRIVPYHAAGAELAKGERIGIIRLGSRVDVALPPGVEPAVRAGQRVRAGSTCLARPAQGSQKLHDSSATTPSQVRPW